DHAIDQASCDEWNCDVQRRGDTNQKTESGGRFLVSFEERKDPPSQPFALNSRSRNVSSCHEYIKFSKPKKILMTKADFVWWKYVDGFSGHPDMESCRPVRIGACQS